MKKSVCIIIFLLFTAGNLLSQNVITVEANNQDISNNLDLAAIASAFGESEDLEDFERRLNDYDSQISNLDLNGDGEVDYLRVVESTVEGTHLIVIQSVIGNDLYQDVATVEVEQGTGGNTYVQVVGDEFLYGRDYIIEPVFIHTPLIFNFFWGNRYKIWHSPYYWGYYPERFHPRHPEHIDVYQINIQKHINIQNSYKFSTARKSKTSPTLHNNIRRNDFEKKNPDSSFSKRNSGVNNARELNENRQTKSTGQGQTGRKVDNNWKSGSKNENKDTGVKDNTRSTQNRTVNTGNDKSPARSTRENTKSGSGNSKVVTTKNRTSEKSEINTNQNQKRADQESIKPRSGNSRKVASQNKSAEKSEKSEPGKNSTRSTKGKSKARENTNNK